MSLHAPDRFAVRSQLRRSAPSPQRRARIRATHRPILEPLEERQLLSLLGLSQLDMKPDIASLLNSISYTQLGNDANPFQYTARPSSIKLPNGSSVTITNPSNGTSAKTSLSLLLKNNGYFASAGTGPDFSINGHVVVNNKTYDGTLLTAQAQDFGFSDTITRADAEFEVLLTITGGQLAQPGGPYAVGAPLALLIHQPGLSISEFPATFTVTNSFTGSSDTSTIPPTNDRQGSHQPLPTPKRDPLNDLQVTPTPTPTAGCNCGSNPGGTPGGLNSSAAGQDSASGAVALYDGTARQQVTAEDVPGRGMDWSLTLTDRGDVQSDGAVGQGWEMNDDQRLEVVNSSNLATFQTAFPTAKVGDVDLIGGSGRDDLYVLNKDGSYTSPAGQYTRLILDPDGSYTERLSDGTVMTYGVPFSSTGIEPMTSISDPQGDEMRFTYNYEDELISATDTLGRPYQYSYDTLGRLTAVTDYIGRTTRFTYDSNDDLTSITTPAVTGTPTGNNFPNGETTRFTYDANHHLLTVTAPDQVLDGGPPRLTYTYDASGRVISLMEGGTNASNVPAGGTITYTYQTIGTPTGPGDTTTAVRQTTATDRDGNVTVYQYNQYNNTIQVTQEMNRGVDPGIPTSTSYTTRYAYDTDYRLLQQVDPLGNTSTNTYDSSNPSRFQQGNLLSTTETPDSARGGDQSAITTTYTYEPIYNHIHTMTEPRGNDPGYVPPNGGSQSAARYTTTYTYDYQEGTNFAELGAILGVSASTAQAMLAAANIPMGLGDVNHDGTTGQVAGNLIREQDPTVTLLPGSNEATAEGTTQQPIVTLYTYNLFGQETSTTDPEGNVTTYTYYPERNPAGTGTILNPDGNSTTGGYRRQTVEDSVSASGRDSGFNPTPARITTTYTYDDVGHQTSVTDGRGIVTQYVYNQLDQLVETIHAAQVPGVSASEPLPLTAFGYIERFFYDANGNQVLHQVEDRGDTSNVGFAPPAGSLPSDITNTEPGGGVYFDDTVTKYDILDQPIETIQEVGGGQFLDTRMRYDPDGNVVLTIQPEGNATTSTYNERNQLFESERGEQSPPPLVLLAPGDPTNYDVRGGANCQCDTYRYDANGNLIESVNADNNNPGSIANTDPTLGPGNTTLYTYDGFDRRTSVIDAVGNQTVYQYDPDGNVVRTTNFGPVGGPSPTSNSPLTPAEPVSQLGVIQSDHLVNSHLLSATETSYDELGRAYQSSQVLFVNTIPTTRTPDVAEGGTDVGLGALTPGQTQAIPGVSGITILGRVCDRTEYDRDSRDTFTVLDDATSTRTLYDGAGRVIETIDPANNTVQTAYDADSNVIETRETDVSQVPGVPHEVFLTTNYYDSLNRLQETVDNLGETMYYRYDSRNNLVATADADGPAGPAITRRAFADGALTNNTTNLPGNVTLYYYDGLDRRVREEQILTRSGQGDGINAGATLQGIKVEASGTSTGSNSSTTLNDTAQSWTTNEWAGLTIQITGGTGAGQYRTVLGNSATQLTVSAAWTTTPDATSTYAIRPIPLPDPNQGDGDGIIRTGWNYDKNSLLSSMIDDDGNVTLYLYDDLNRQVLQSEGLVVGSTDTEANILGSRVIPTPTAATIDSPATIPNSEINTQLAEAQSLIAAVAPLFPTLANQVNDRPPTTKVWGYSPNDDVLIYQDENGSETFTRYDAIDRPIAVRIFRAGQHDSFTSDPIFAPEPASAIPLPANAPVVPGTTIQNYQYDGLSRLTYASDNNDPTTTADDSAVTDAYDSLGRIIEEAQTIAGQPTQVISSAWRADALRKSMTYPNGRVEVYTYDDLQRLKTVSDQGDAQPIAEYEYMGVDRVLERLYPQNGTMETFLNNAGTVDIGYDGMRRPIEDRTLGSGNALVIGFTYTYDRMGNKLTEGKLHDPNNSETYTYDSAYRLITFNRAPGGIAPLQSRWTLDGVGNWSQVNGQSQQFSSTNELIQTAPATGGPATVLYDNNGNETNDGTYQYTYDALNRLTSVTRDSDHTLIAVYRYDALGRRIQKVVTNDGSQDGTTEYDLDGQQDIEEHNGSGTLTQQYVYGSGIDEVLVMDRAGGRRLFYNQNALGSVYALTNTSGQVVEGYQYDAYGRQTVFDPGPGNAPVFSPGETVSVGGISQVGNPFLFTGQRLDPEDGLYYYRARLYDPTQGRFLQRDPQNSMGAANRYEYAESNPLDWVDPLGLAAEPARTNPRRVVVSFVDDVVTGAAWYAHTPGPGNANELIAVTDEGTAAIPKMVSEIIASLGRHQCIESLIITGHGKPGGFGGDRLSADWLDTASKDVNPRIRSELQRLAPLFCKKNEGVTLKMCNTAEGPEGKKLLKELASLVGTTVKGWEGTYEILPSGPEYTGTPGGTVVQTGQARADVTQMLRNAKENLANSPAPWYVKAPLYPAVYGGAGVLYATKFGLWVFGAD